MLKKLNLPEVEISIIIGNSPNKCFTCYKNIHTISICQSYVLKRKVFKIMSCFISELVMYVNLKFRRRV